MENGKSEKGKGKVKMEKVNNVKCKMKNRTEKIENIILKIVKLKMSK